MTLQMRVFGLLLAVFLFFPPLQRALAAGTEPVTLDIGVSSDPMIAGRSVDYSATIRSVHRAPFGVLVFEENTGLEQSNETIPGPMEPDSLTAGSSHTCFLTADGTAKCFGDNSTYGQLGTGDLVNRTSPVAVSGLAAGNLAIVAGDTSTCVLTAERAVKCWGNNGFGQLGQNDGLFRNSSVPVQVSGLTSGVTKIVAGGAHFCALKGNDLYCWGRNSDGQLGIGSTVNKDVPVAVTGITDSPADIAAGTSHSCAISLSSDVWCWGKGTSGQLGTGTTPSRLTSPTSIGQITDTAYKIFAGGNETCVLNTVSRAYCWGLGTSGQIGDGFMVSRSSPTLISLSLTFGHLSIGASHTCGLSNDYSSQMFGGLRCWGSNSNGQIGGQAAGANEPDPYGVDDLWRHVTAVAAGGQHSCALVFSDYLYCWGTGLSGQLGTGNTSSSAVPVPVAGQVDRVVDINVGGLTGCYLMASGAASCWGDDTFGTIGNGAGGASSSPSTVQTSERLISLSGGNTTRCALTAEGTVQCWGHGSSGDVGDGGTSHREAPVFVTGLDLEGSANAAASGNRHGCALKNDGQAVCWGSQLQGRLGNGLTSAASISSPVSVSGGHSFDLIRAGGDFTCARPIFSNGFKCWGNNSSGQVGNGTSTSEFATPQDAATPASTGFIDLDLGFAHGCAIDEYNDVYCWGSNSSGQIGQPLTTANSSTPLKVVGLAGAAVQVDVGDNFSCALIANGSVDCWGRNRSGELGLSTSITSSPTPVHLAGFTEAVTRISAGGSTVCFLMASTGVTCQGEGSEAAVLGNGAFLDSSVPVTVTGSASSSFERHVSWTGRTPALGFNTISVSFLEGLLGTRDVRFHGAHTKALGFSVVNHAPTFTPLALTVVEDESRAGTMPGNDSDGHSLTYSVVTSPGKGTLSLATDGSYSYTANGNGAVADSFTVRASDPYGGTANLTVPVTITGRTLTGTTGPDNLDGGDAIDNLTGLDGNDYLDGKAGADVMTGGKGDDTYIVDDSGDRTIEVAGQGYDKIIASLSFTLPSEVEWLVLAGSDALSGTGNSGDNRLTGNVASNRLNGLGGKDRLEGLGGPDILDGGAGIDEANYAASPVGVSIDLLTGKGKKGDAAGDQLISIENLRGSPKADRLAGQKGPNRFTGGRGADRLTGRGGADVFTYESVIDSPAAGPDVITDFSVAQKDIVDLTLVDARSKPAGRNDKFIFVGSKAFSGKAGQLRFVPGRLEGDVNGDRKADLVILLPGVKILGAKSIKP